MHSRQFQLKTTCTLSPIRFACDAVEPQTVIQIVQLHTFAGEPMSPEAQKYLDRFLSGKGNALHGHMTRFDAFHFCNDAYNANLCVELVISGKKTATCGLAYWYDTGEERIPEVGLLAVILDWQQNPRCLIEFISIDRCKFEDVTAEFAVMEGEGDQTLNWWRNAHWDFFKKELAILEKTPCEKMELVLETFRLIDINTL